MSDTNQATKRAADPVPVVAKKSRKRTAIHEDTFRCKGLMSSCHTLKDIYEQLRSTADWLEEMDKTGKVDADNQGCDDYCFLHTTDEEVAKKYGFNEMEFDDEWDDDDEYSYE